VLAAVEIENRQEGSTAAPGSCPQTISMNREGDGDSFEAFENAEQMKAMETFAKALQQAGQI